MPFCLQCAPGRRGGQPGQGARERSGTDGDVVEDGYGSHDVRRRRNQVGGDRDDAADDGVDGYSDDSDDTDGCPY
jgi:hypothetical protein